MSTKLRLALGLVPVLVSQPALAVLTVKVVGIQGDIAPNGAPYKRFKNPAIGDAAGERVVVFNPTMGAEKCFFRVNPAIAPASPTGSTVACVGDEVTINLAPLTNRNFTKFGDPPSINLSGTPAWWSRLSFAENGVFSGSPPAPVVLNQETTPAGGLFDDFSVVKTTDTQGVAFLSTIFGGPVAEGIFRCFGGNNRCSTPTGGTGVLQTLVLLNDMVTDRAAPQLFVCSFTGLAASDWGIAFGALVSENCADTVTFPLKAGIFRKIYGGTIATLALQDENSNPDGTQYLSMGRGSPSISNNGNVAFLASTQGIEFDTNLYLCLITSTCQPTTILTRADPVVEEGTNDADGNSFRIFSPPSVSDAGDIAFNARISGGPAGPSSGVYIRYISGVRETIARKGLPAPVTGPSADYGDLHIAPPAISSLGKVVFKARLRRSVAPRTRQAIFAAEP